MKTFTHPSISYTFIRLKDGSSYGKHWMYLRSALILEGDQKIWDSFKQAKAHKVFSMSDTVLQKQNASFLDFTYVKSGFSSFWIR